MGSVGAKVSRPGIDVGLAQDAQLLISSSWPALKIGFSGSFTITNRNTSQVVITHNLGYVPMFMIFDNPGGASRYRSYGYIVGGYFGVNSTELKFFSDGSTSGSRTIYYYIFLTPLQTNFSAPVIGTLPDISTPAGDNYGIKVAKDGKSANSTDMRDFVVHSSTATAGVHIVDSALATLTGVVDPSTKMHRIAHGLGYEPLAFCFVNYGANAAATFNTGYWYAVGGVGGASDYRFYTNSTYVSFEENYLPNPSATSTSSFVILKEPFDTINGYQGGFFY